MKIITKTSEDARQDKSKEHEESLCPECSRQCVLPYRSRDVKGILKHYIRETSYYECDCGCEFKVVREWKRM